MVDTILYCNENGIEFWTVAATGESFISAEGLAKKCGVSYETLELLAADIEEGKNSDPVFAHLKGDCRWKMMSQPGQILLDGSFVIEVKEIANYLSYFARKGNFIAARELQDLVQSHGHPFVRQTSVFEWLEVQSKALACQDSITEKTQLQESGFIYLIGCLSSNVAKIGFSTDVQARLKSLQTGFPFKLSILGVIKGTIQEEKLLHKKFEDFRLEGEWFSLCKRSKQLFSDAFSDGIQADIFFDDEDVA